MIQISINKFQKTNNFLISKIQFSNKRKSVRLEL